MTRPPSLGPRGEGWVALQALLLAATGLAGIVAGDAWIGPLRPVTTVAGVALILAGGGLALRAMRDLGSALTPFPRPRADTTVVATGAYRFVRHPIYGGIILGSVGWALVTASLVALALALALLAFFDLKSRREEAWLVAHDPGYTVSLGGRRRLIPWVW